MSITIVHPRDKTKVHGAFNMILNYSEDITNEIALYINKTIFKKYELAKKIRIVNIPVGKLEIEVLAISKSGRILRSDPIRVSNDVAPITQISESQENAYNDSLSEGEENKEDLVSSQPEIEEIQPESVSDVLQETCRKCGNFLRDCGCGKKKPPVESLSDVIKETCRKCGNFLGDCGCGKKKPPPVESSSDEIQETWAYDKKLLPIKSDEDKPQILHSYLPDCHKKSGKSVIYTHKSTRIPAEVNEVMIASEARSKMVLYLPNINKCGHTLTITNYSQHCVDIISEDCDMIQTYNGKYNEVNLVSHSYVTLVYLLKKNVWALRE